MATASRLPRLKDQNAQKENRWWPNRAIIGFRYLVQSNRLTALECFSQPLSRIVEATLDRSFRRPKHLTDRLYRVPFQIECPKRVTIQFAQTGDDRDQVFGPVASLDFLVGTLPTYAGFFQGRRIEGDRKPTTICTVDYRRVRNHPQPSDECLRLSKLMNKPESPQADVLKQVFRVRVNEILMSDASAQEQVVTVHQLDERVLVSTLSGANEVAQRAAPQIECF